LECNFLKVVSSAIVDKYIGESARLIREMFAYAKEHEPCIIFMGILFHDVNILDEIDAIGGRRFSEGTSADREIQRTLMELLNQMDGFDYLGQTKLIMVCILNLLFPGDQSTGYARSRPLASGTTRPKD
jgi:26S proteasome regulatory subunit T4